MPARPRPGQATSASPLPGAGAGGSEAVPPLGQGFRGLEAAQQRGCRRAARAPRLRPPPPPERPSPSRAGDLPLTSNQELGGWVDAGRVYELGRVRLHGKIGALQLTACGKVLGREPSRLRRTVLGWLRGAVKEASGHADIFFCI